MAYIDMALPEFLNRFSSEEACLDAVFEARWPRGFVCPYCLHNDGIRLRCRPRIVECCLCRRQTSITASTLFHRSHVPLTDWFLVIYLFSQDKGGASVTRLVTQVGVSVPTAWYMLQRLRMAMSTRDQNLTLAGYIELDEAFFGGRFKNKGKRKPPGTNKQQVLVMVESEGRHAGNLVMKVINSDEYADLKPVIAQNIEADPPGQWFRSDGWGSHHVVMAFGHHIKMQHVSPEEQDQQLRCVNLAISHAKRFFKGTYHHFCKMHMQRYLDEFCYRWNRRHLFGQIAGHMLTACILHPHVPYSSIRSARVSA